MKAISMILTIIGFLLWANYAHAVTVTVDFTGTISNRHAMFVGLNYTPGALEVGENPETSIVGAFSYDYDNYVPESSDYAFPYFKVNDVSLSINNQYAYHADTGKIILSTGAEVPFDGVLIMAPLVETSNTPMANDLVFNMFLVPRGGRFPSYEHSAFQEGNILTTWELDLFYPTASIGSPGLWLYGVTNATDIVFEVDSLHSYPPVPEPSTFAMAALGLLVGLAVRCRCRQFD